MAKRKTPAATPLPDSDRGDAIVEQLAEATRDLQRISAFLSDVGNDETDPYDAARAHMLGHAAAMHALTLEWAVRRLREPREV